MNFYKNHYIYTTMKTFFLPYKPLFVYIIAFKTLKGIRGVRLDNRKVLRAPGPWTKYLERLFFIVQ